MRYRPGFAGLCASFSLQSVDWKNVTASAPWLVFSSAPGWIYLRSLHRYWRAQGARHWVFGAKDGRPLALHSDPPIHRHLKVRGTASPFDGDLIYWASRLGRHPELPASKTALLKRQRGRCARCGLVFLDVEELIECDHIVPKALHGTDGKRNRQLLHEHCHDAKTAADGSHRPQPPGVPVTRAKLIPVEEPYDEKSARTVL